MDAIIIFTAKYLFIISVATYLIFSFALFRTNIQKFRYFFLLSLFSFLLIYVVGKILNVIIVDPRPFVIKNISPLIVHAADNGFPSAYTLVTIAIAAVVFVYNKKLGIILFIVSLMVGLARVLAYIINPIDILGSMIIGISITAFVFSFIALHSMYNDDNAY